MHGAPTTSTRGQLTLVERIQLALLRALMWIAKWLAPLRNRGAGLRVERFRYGTHPLELGDVIEDASGTVASDAAARTPVVYVHGGGWVAGHRVVYTGDLGFLAEAGRPVANLDYPLAPESPHPEPLRALLRALAHLRREDERFARVHLVGDSAGGNLVVMLALLLEQRDAVEAWAPGATADTHPEIAGVVSIYGVLDRLSWLEHGFPASRLMMRSYGGSPALEAEVGPELAITPLDRDIDGGPPMWIAYGDADPLAESSRLGAAHLAQGGIRTHLECHPGERHGFFNFAGRPESQRLRADILRFLDDVDAGRALGVDDGADGSAVSPGVATAT